MWKCGEIGRFRYIDMWRFGDGEKAQNVKLEAWEREEGRWKNLASQNLLTEEFQSKRRENFENPLLHQKNLSFRLGTLMER